MVSREEFNKLVQEHGNISFRSLEGTTVEEADEYCHQFMYEDNIGYNYGGGRLYGNGLYIAKNSSTEEFLSGAEVAASRDSFGYGQSQMAIVYDKSTKLIKKDELEDIISGMSDDEKQRYGESGVKKDVKVLTDYAAALGYDGVINEGRYGVDYITIFNRTKLYVCEDINHIDDGITKW